MVYFLDREKLNLFLFEIDLNHEAEMPDEDILNEMIMEDNSRDISDTASEISIDDSLDFIDFYENNRESSDYDKEYETDFEMDIVTSSDSNEMNLNVFFESNTFSYNDELFQF